VYWKGGVQHLQGTPLQMMKTNGRPLQMMMKSNGPLMSAKLDPWEYQQLMTIWLGLMVKQ